ncbi:hypothetical protein ACFO0A_11760 [Novosphingobium tardum]|uniref:PEP-CTERM protein-sorting domain-containing protein n=1 Tax=Novosphingobium tardum TaxID=1538021 RepID=A0ABV8RSA1_9SPHN
MGRALYSLATLAGLLVALGWSAPLLATTGAIAIPDLSGAGLFMLGLAGLVIGREGARRRPPD